MRLPVAACSLVMFGATTVAADQSSRSGQVRNSPDFWQEILEPHGEEVQQVLGKINTALEVATRVGGHDSDPDGSQRARLLDDARGMARYLRRLSPTSPAVLFAVGRIADDAGRADEAIEALSAYLAMEPDTNEAAFRLGRLHLRRRNYGEAIRYLRIASAPAAWNGHAVVYLAAALTAVGKDEDALAVLRATGEGAAMWGSEPQLANFALAVAYDRDEQLSLAFEVIDRMQSALQANYMATLQAAIDGLVPVPAIDVHYYRGLLYETGGYLDEARVSWLLYAGGRDEARFRKRALAHVAAIDRLREQELAARKRGRRATVPAVRPSRPPPRGRTP